MNYQRNQQTTSRINILSESSKSIKLDRTELSNLRGGEWVVEEYEEDGEIKYRLVYR